MINQHLKMFVSKINESNVEDYVNSANIFLELLTESQLENIKFSVLHNALCETLKFNSKTKDFLSTISSIVTSIQELNTNNPLLENYCKENYIKLSRLVPNFWSLKEGDKLKTFEVEIGIYNTHCLELTILKKQKNHLAIHLYEQSSFIDDCVGEGWCCEMDIEVYRNKECGFVEVKNYLGDPYEHCNYEERRSDLEEKLNFGFGKALDFWLSQNHSFQPKKID